VDASGWTPVHEILIKGDFNVTTVLDERTSSFINDKCQSSGRLRGFGSGDGVCAMIVHGR
jgi:hypothetical protein